MSSSPKGNHINLCPGDVLEIGATAGTVHVIIRPVGKTSRANINLRLRQMSLDGDATAVITPKAPPVAPEEPPKAPPVAPEELQRMTLRLRQMSQDGDETAVITAPKAPPVAPEELRRMTPEERTVPFPFATTTPAANETDEIELEAEEPEAPKRELSPSKGKSAPKTKSAPKSAPKTKSAKRR